MNDKALASDAALGLALPGPRAAAAFTHHERRQARRILLVLSILGLYFCLELAGAIWADSTVLKVEALHILTDVVVLGLAFLAMRIAVRAPTARFTYGLRRAEPVAAIFNALLVLVLTVLLVVEAGGNLFSGPGPRADRMLYVAIFGFVVNAFAAWLIHGAIGSHPEHDHIDHAHENAQDEPFCHDHDHHHIAQHAEFAEVAHGHALNMRGALLHLLGDALGSLSALVAAVAMRFGASPKADPIASFVVAAILIYGGVRLLKDAVLVLLEASPRHLPIEQVRATIIHLRGVADVHELHVWSLGAGHDAITAHVRANEPVSGLARNIERALRERFQVEYVTIQVEAPGQGCASFPP